MERNIPHESSKAIDFYLRTIYSVLRSKSETRISGFEEAHSSLVSMLHPDARAKTPDFSALIYCILRLPFEILSVNKVVLGQNMQMFVKQFDPDIENWQVVSARARRRFCLFDQNDTLACFITSRSDIDDLVPALTALQIEWNKIHYLLQDVPEDMLTGLSKNDSRLPAVAEAILSPVEDLQRLFVILGSETGRWLMKMKHHSSELRIRLLDSSLIQYARSTKNWMQNIIEQVPNIQNRPIYFVSSNTHSLANVLTGFALQKEKMLVDFLNKPENETLKNEWNLIEKKKLAASRENLLYYVLKKYQQSDEGAFSIEEQLEIEDKSGIFRIDSVNTFDLDAQIVDIASINPARIDPRISVEQVEMLRKSNAIIINIDYPLGMTAYNVLSKIAETFEEINGIYIMGKAASFNGIYGDVVIPTVVHDMHSANTYIFQNAFSGADIEPWLIYGSILDNQRAVSVFGTFLQNREFMDALYDGGYTDIEMEAGPYLSAISEMVRANRHPVDEMVTLHNCNFDIGILHYVSDTPMSKGKNLGAGTLSYFGIDSTYAATIAILRRIFTKEIAWIQQKN